ncbi:hypothetical protein JHK85_053535 [Glycine max]|nr:hypothetical protein JHK85_053535 [Glycine max]
MRQEQNDQKTRKRDIWLERVTTAKEADWKRWGVFNAINLTHHDVESNYPLIFSLATPSPSSTFTHPIFLSITKEALVEYFQSPASSTLVILNGSPINDHFSHVEQFILGDVPSDLVVLKLVQFGLPIHHKSIFGQIAGLPPSFLIILWYLNRN